MVDLPDDDKFGDFIKSNVHYMNDEEIARHKPVLFTRIKKRTMKLATELYKLPEIIGVDTNKKNKIDEASASHIDSFSFNDEKSRSLSTIKGQNRSVLKDIDKRIKGRRKAIWDSKENRKNISMPLNFNREHISEKDSVEEILNQKRITIPDRAYLVRKLNMTYKEILEKRYKVEDEGLIKVVDTGITPIKGKFFNLANQEFWERSTRKHIKFKSFIEKVSKISRLEKKKTKTPLEKFFLTVNKPKDPLYEYINLNFLPDFTLKDPTLSVRHIKVPKSQSQTRKRLPSIYDISKDLIRSQSRISNDKYVIADLSMAVKQEFGVSIDLVL